MFACHQARADDLLAVFRTALRHDPQYLASDAGRLAAQELVPQARAALLPRLDTGYEYAKAWDESQGGQAPMARAEVRTIEDYDSRALTVEFRQPLYDHGAWLGLSQAGKRAYQAELDHKAEYQGLLVRAAEAYFGVLFSAEAVAFAEAEQSAIAQELAQTRLRFEQGLGTITDVHEAQSRHDLAAAETIQTRYGVTRAREALRRLTGAPPPELAPLAEGVSLRGPEPAGIEDWVRIAEEHSPILEARRLALDVAREEVGRRRAGHYPRLDLVAGYRDSRSDGMIEAAGGGLDSFASAAVSRSVGVRFSLPLYEGGLVPARIDESQYLFQQEAQRLELSHRQVTEQVRDSHSGMMTALESSEVLQQAVTSGQNALKATQLGFEAGKRTMIDVLLSTHNLYAAKYGLARARYDYLLNILRLKQAAGLLGEADSVEINGRLRR